MTFHSSAKDGLKVLQRSLASFSSTSWAPLLPTAFLVDYPCLWLEAALFLLGGAEARRSACRTWTFPSCAPLDRLKACPGSELMA